MEKSTKMEVSVTTSSESVKVSAVVCDAPPFNWRVEITLCGAPTVKILERETLEGLQKALQLAIDRLF
jgi:hypothetical protein